MNDEQIFNRADFGELDKAYQKGYEKGVKDIKESIIQEIENHRTSKQKELDEYFELFKVHESQRQDIGMSMLELVSSSYIELVNNTEVKSHG